MREPNVEMFGIIHRILSSSLPDVAPINFGSAASLQQLQCSVRCSVAVSGRGYSRDAGVQVLHWSGSSADEPHVLCCHLLLSYKVNQQEVEERTFCSPSNLRRSSVCPSSPCLLSQSSQTC